MTLLVTGVAGFIGSHLTEKLLGQGQEVVGLDNFNDFYSPRVKRGNLAWAQKHKSFTLFEKDVTDRIFLEKLFKKYRFEKVIHLAARAGVRPSFENPNIYVKDNLLGTLSLLETIKRFPVKNFIFASSSSVYGNSSRAPFSENSDTDTPLSPYGATKKAGELLCFTYHQKYKIPTTILRFFTVYGPRQRPDMAIHLFTKLILEKKEIPVFGEGNSERDYTYIGDVLQGILAALQKQFDFEIFNLGTSHTIMLKDLIGLLEKNLKQKARLKFFPFFEGDMRLTYANISRARKLLNYKPRTRLEDGLKEFIAWYKKG